MPGHPGAPLWHDPGVESAIAGYLRASEANDLDALMEAMAPDAELVSPLSGRMTFRGHDDLRVLLGAVYATLSDLRWGDQIGDGPARVVIGDCRVGPLRLSDAMAFDLAEDGRIRRIRPHLRPWLATSLFALLLGPQIARHPGIVARALRPA
jgi:SnoaL-like domain